MDLQRMDALSDWDDWAEDEPEWWLRHPLHRPRKLTRVKPTPVRKENPYATRKRTIA
jgi:hypothetical protein